MKPPARTTLLERRTASAIRRFDLETRGEREERFVGADAGHELEGERQPQWVDAYPMKAVALADGAKLEPAEKTETIDRLRGLGYIE